MKSVLIRELIESGIEGPARVLSVFVVDDHLNEDLFDGELTKVLATSNLFERAHFVGTTNQLKKLDAWLKVGRVSGDRIRRVLRDFEKEVLFITFDLHACVHKALDAQLKIASSSEQKWLESERRAALLHAFDSSDGMMKAPQGFHYKKTSTAHSTRFLRTANVLEAPENLALVAFWLLPIVGKQGVDQVIVDTSGIYSAALLAVHQLSAARRASLTPKVWSHNSFGGLAEIPSISSSAVCIISATTSGTLRQRLIEKGASPERVWTIYGLARPGKRLENLLCDLGLDATKSKTGHKHIENEPFDSCRYCKQGSLAVQIAGDQFVLEPPQVTEIDFGVSDMPDSGRRLLGEMVGTGLLKVYRARTGRLSGNYEIFLDIAALFSFFGRVPDESLSDYWKKFKNNWSTLQARAMTTNVERVVYTSHPYSATLAERIAMQYLQLGLSKPLVLPQSALRHQSGTQGSGTIVAAACIDDMQELMMIKRDLRDVQKYGSIWFVSPFVRSSDSDAPEKLRRLIGYGEFGQGTFSVQHCCFFLVPECTSPTVWDRELQILRDIKEYLLIEGEEVPAALNEREALLGRAMISGLADNLFWRNAEDQPLRLRNEFTLISSQRAFSQADVYVALSCYLHHLRRGSPNGTRLLYTPFARSVLSPSLFTKFNDGILQAAMLRSAREHELHYANCEESTSQSMLGVLLTELGELENGGGEALMEFILALIDRRLTLMLHHTLKFCDSVDESNAPVLAKYAARYLRQLIQDD